jgi:hypothetical protein
MLDSSEMEFFIQVNWEMFLGMTLLREQVL